jgi:hypothetical protein
MKKFTIELTEKEAELIVDCLTIAQAGYYQRIQQLLLGPYLIKEFHRAEADKYRGKAHEIGSMIRHVIYGKILTEGE